ncbi:asparagine synthase-related protein [Novosphingobium aquiterrae]|uniref:Asparagine synthase-related protein n=1 Tax=Novosphingobium aquiterrae TaxID=624388 RepID=A0ABV6PJ92_9SPHN
MLALLIGPRASEDGLGERTGASLGLFAGVAVSAWRDDNRIAWQLPRVGDLPARSQRRKLAGRTSLAPTILSDGTAVQVHGWIDNCRELAAELGCPADDQAHVYGCAVKAWGDEADCKVLGGYCATYHRPGSGELRLARSPLYGPPLYYMHNQDAVAAASVPRVLEAMGLPRVLNRQRLVDSLYFNLTDEESYLKGSFKVPYGAVVHVSAQARRAHRFYDPLKVPKQPRASARDYVDEADRLLTDACARYRDSAHNAGVLLSGGLDSPNVAARLLRGMPQERRLQAFTYVPLEGHGQPDIPGGLADEGPAVRAFCAIHPAIEPHFVDNRDYEFDHRLEDMFLAMGTGTVNLAAFFRYHGIFTAARDAGCDMVLSADHGNFTFSASGNWGYAEYLRKGRLIELWRALRGESLRPGSLGWRFLALAVAPMLPYPVWRLAMHLRGRSIDSDNVEISALRPEALRDFAVEARARQAGTRYERPLYGWREGLIRDNFARGDVEGSDMIQGWEQLYEVSMRDPTSYRPLVDFCLGLPTDMFLRDGQTRWLGRELGRGLMPEAQRTMPGHGQHNSDWHKRLTPRRDDMRREVAAIRADPVLAGLIDTDLLLANIDNWPAAQSIENDIYFPHAFRLPRAIAMGRYVRFMTGSNASHEA